MKLTFETGVLAEITKKAAKIAPTKGVAFDKAAGLLIEIYPGMDWGDVIVKATDTQVFWATWTKALKVEPADGEGEKKWRLPAQLLAQLIASFPTTSGSSVTLDDASGRLEIACNKTRAQIHMMDPGYFPEFELFDGSELAKVTGFTARIAQVQWACDDKQIPLCGIHLDGKSIIATDRYRIAVVPCEIPLSEPVTIPTEVVAPLVKEVSEVQLAVFEGKLYMMPSSEEQITSITYAEEFPPVEGILTDNAPETYPHCVRFSAESMRGKIDRMKVMVKGDRFPRLDVTIGQERIYLTMSIEGVGFMDDEIDLSGQALHDDCTYSFGPSSITETLLNSPNDMVTMFYRPDNVNRPIHIDGESGYKTWIAPRRYADEPVRPK